MTSLLYVISIQDLHVTPPFRRAWALTRWAYGNLLDYGFEQPWRSMEAFAQACSVPWPKFVGGEPASTGFESTWILRFELYL